MRTTTTSFNEEIAMTDPVLDPPKEPIDITVYLPDPYDEPSA